MKLRTRFTLNFLIFALLPLMLAMSVSVWHSSNQTRGLAIDMAQASLRAESHFLAAYFEQRLSEIAQYSDRPDIRSMNFAASKVFLLTELEHHQGIYEKFIMGLPSGHYYYTGGGNPAYGGLASFDNKDPDARLKSIRVRDYWRYTVGENVEREMRDIVSSPMISFTTGAKQVMVARTLMSDEGEVVGMLGGSLPWESIEQMISKIQTRLEREVPWSSRFMLVSPEGVYWYHWNPEKVVHLAKDADGQPIFNEFGEKITVRSKITEEPIQALSNAGRAMIAGKDGHTVYVDPETGNKEFIVYSAVNPGGYSVAAVIPEKEIMAPVYNLQRALGAILLVAILLVVTAAFLLSRRVTQPILSLSQVAHHISKGSWEILPTPDTGDEVADLTQSFNAMTNAVRKREQQLLEIDERFERTVHGASDALWEWNIATDEVWYATRLREILGYEEDEFPPVFASFEDRLHPDDRDRVIKAVEFHLQYQTVYDVEFRLRHKSGEYRWFRARGATTRNENGTPILMSGSNMDITEKKKIEASLILAKEEAEHANEAKSQFLSSMSHELRTPLNAILGFSQLLSLQELPEAQARQVEHINKASCHLRDLVNQVLDLSQIEAGNLNIQIENIDATEVLTECIDQIDESLARSRHVTLENNIIAQACWVKADRLRLRQVIFNVLSNAVKYNRDHGSVTVDITDEGDGNIRIGITDTGIGICSDHLDKLFDPFERLDFKAHGKIEGTGIGLTVTRQLMEAMGGKIAVESEVNVGSCFWLILPKAGELKTKGAVSEQLCS